MCHQPSAGHIVILTSIVTRAFNTSMEVACSCVREDPISGEQTLICEGFFTFVAIGDDGKRVKLPPLVPVSSEEQLSYDLAQERSKRAVAVPSSPSPP